MTFTEALSAVFNDGDRITRPIWNNRKACVCVHDGMLCTTWDTASMSVDGLYHPWDITEQDYFADDWEVVVDG